MSNDAVPVHLQNMIQRLKGVSPSFCLAKWLQVTLHLQNGNNHSCHHPVPHATSVDAVKANPSALHNTPAKLEARKQMLAGKRPSECDYCWRIEDADKNSISDRHFKSNDVWAEPYFDEVAQMPWDQHVKPRYVEVSFSNVCNFKCMYCNPGVSSAWMADVKKNGGFQLTNSTWIDSQWTKRISDGLYPEEDKNPYVKAFWDWWPDIVGTLRVFRITGGEPFLSPSTLKVVDELTRNPQPGLDFAINTNLGMRSAIAEKAASALQKMLNAKSVKEFTLFTSLDTWGNQAEYIRDGLDIELFKKNFSYFLENVSPMKITFMVTFNILSYSKFNEFLQYVLEQRDRARELGTGTVIYVDISYVRNPSFLAPHLATPDLIDRADDILNFMKANAEEKRVGGFQFWEIEKMQRMITWIKGEHDPDEIRRLRSDFYAYLLQADKRRGTSFNSTFPEYEEFYDVARGSHFVEAPRG